MMPATRSRRCMPSAPAACSCAGSVWRRRRWCWCRTLCSREQCRTKHKWGPGFDDQCEDGGWMEDSEASRKRGNGSAGKLGFGVVERTEVSVPDQRAVVLLIFKRIISEAGGTGTPLASVSMCTRRCCPGRCQVATCLLWAQRHMQARASARAQASMLLPSRAPVATRVFPSCSSMCTPASAHVRLVAASSTASIELWAPPHLFPLPPLPPFACSPRAGDDADKALKLTQRTRGKR